MRRLIERRIMPLLLAFMLVLITIVPSELIVQAATDIALNVRYNAVVGTYELYWRYTAVPGSLSVTWHQPDGTLYSTNAATLTSGEAVVQYNFQPDHIYDVRVNMYTVADPVTPAYSGLAHMLVDITFTGESFNEMAKFRDIEDNNPNLDGELPGSAVIVRSGANPLMKLKWKIPTIYAGGAIRYITDRTSAAPTAAISLIDAPVTEVGFQVSMTKGKGGNTVMTYNTEYNGANMRIASFNTPVTDITNGIVTSLDGYVTLTFENTEGIEPGTEYEFVNIGLILKNALGEQVPLRRTNMKTDQDNRFTVLNVDNAFSDYGTELTSIFTPLYFEMTKVDVDKVEIRFRKVTNGVYPELFYQVQHSSRLDDLYSTNMQWTKIPNASLAAGEQFGSTIVEFDLPGYTHPEYYFRVVFYDSGSTTPRNSSLAVNLQLLGTDTGKPPLPRDVKITPIYTGREDVVTHDGTTVEIPSNDLKISFEKPLSWKEQANWNAFKANPYADEDYTFHFLISTWLPGTVTEPEPRVIGLTNTATIYMPVKQKRVLVVSKKDLTEDPLDPDRLVFTMDGTDLFRDEVMDTNITFENNEDASEDAIPGDYPDFLVPNTMYYAQVFTSRYEDIPAINADIWGDAAGLAPALQLRLSYTSPITSFTTYPLEELPVPIPVHELGIEPTTNVDPVTGVTTLTGISVSYERILSDAEWIRYTTVQDDRVVEYTTYVSKTLNEADFRPILPIDDAPYPAEADQIQRGISISQITLPNGSTESILPNTTYYVKMQASLRVGGLLIGRSDYTAIKSITTPKIDTGSLDDITRYPRSPVEFTIAKDNDGELLLSDAWVELTWSHVERDVDYELILTSVPMDPDAVEADWATDTDNLALLAAYTDFRDPPTDVVIHIDMEDPALAALGFTYNAETKTAILPIRRTLLRPNRLYYFSLRAVRQRDVLDINGDPIEKFSSWVTIPVTTKMVKSPGLFEAVRDLQLGFNVICSIANTNQDSFEVYLKKTDAADTEYRKLLRSEYAIVRDGTRYYVRLNNLLSNTWYDIRMKNTINGQWYNDATAAWQAAPGSPVQQKTRDTLKEIEVRWVGEDPYAYFFEARTITEASYATLTYRATGMTDYGYNLKNGTRIAFYREKTTAQVASGSAQYMYYTVISGKPVVQSDGTILDKELATNTHYYVKMWARNVEDSLHVGPVDVRTDFSQVDYDENQSKDSILYMFNQQADKLTEKLWWNVDRNATGKMRVLLKSERVSAILDVSPDMTLTLDLGEERSGLAQYDVLIPQQVIETIERTGARLKIRVTGADMTISRGSLDFAALKASVTAANVKETMALVSITRKTAGSTAVPVKWSLASSVYGLSVTAIGSRQAYGEIAATIEKILRDKTATGPFRYGILDRELTALEKNADAYTYRSHTDLMDMVASLIGKVETEMSRYLKDILDGGSGLAAAITGKTAVKQFPGSILVGMDYSWQSGRITPIVLPLGTTVWDEPDGMRAYVMQSAMMRTSVPGEFAIGIAQSVSISGGASASPDLGLVAAKYDLSKVFGSVPVYPGNDMTGQQAVLLFEVISGREEETVGLTMAQRLSTLGLGDVIPTRQLASKLEKQRAVSLAVLLYGDQIGVPASKLKTTRNIYIANQTAIDTKLLPYVRLGLDMKFTSLDAARKFDAKGIARVSDVMGMVVKAMNKSGLN